MLNGWQRLGIVISVSWAVFVALSVTWDYVFFNGRDWSYGDIVVAVFVPVLAGWLPYEPDCRRELRQVHRQAIADAMYKAGRC